MKHRILSALAGGLLFPALAPAAGVYLEAEQYLTDVAAAFAPFQVFAEPLTSGGAYVDWPDVGPGIEGEAIPEPVLGSEDASAGQIHFRVRPRRQADCTLWVRALQRTFGDNSFWMAMPGATDPRFKQFNGAPASDWEWEEVYTFRGVPAGEQLLKIARREGGTGLDVFYLTDGTRGPLVLASRNALWPTEALLEAEDFDWSSTLELDAIQAAAGNSQGSWVTLAPGQVGDWGFMVDDRSPVAAWARVRRAATGPTALRVRLENAEADFRDLTPVVASAWTWVRLVERPAVEPGVYTIQLAAPEGLEVDRLFVTTSDARPVALAQVREAEDPTSPAGALWQASTDDPFAVRGGHLVWPNDGTNRLLSAEQVREDQAFAYEVEQPYPGAAVKLYLRVKFNSTTNDSLYWKIDGVRDWTLVHSLEAPEWRWVEVADLGSLAVGRYTIRVHPCEDGARLDQLLLGMDGAGPPKHILRPDDALDGHVFYVVPGLGADSNPGTYDRPWRTIQKAAASLQAGQKVYLREGLYEQTTQNIDIRLSGREDAWIEFAAYPGESVIIDGTKLVGRSINSLLHLENCRYVRVRGLTVRNSPSEGIGASVCQYLDILDNRVDLSWRSGIAVWGSADSGYSTHVRVLGNTVTRANSYQAPGADRSYPKPDHEAMSFGRVSDFEIAYNQVAGGDKEGIDSKGPNRRGWIHHNYIHHKLNQPYLAPIYIDAWTGAQTDIQIHDNVCHDAGGISINSEDGQGVENIQVHHNTVYSSVRAGISVVHMSKEDRQPAYTRNVWVHQNTTWHTNWGLEIAETGHFPDLVITTDVWAYDNIFSHCEYDAITLGEVNQGTNVDPVTHNLHVYNNVIHNYRPGYTGTNAVLADPLFLDPAHGDFRLREGSPAITAGQDGATAGAIPYPLAPPAPASGPGPLAGATVVPAGITLTWDAAARADDYVVYLDTAATFGPEDRWATTRQPEFRPGLLQPGTEYFWQVVARNREGQTAGPVWSFRTGGDSAPGVLQASFPADGQGQIYPDAVLSWYPSERAQGYEVYFSQDAAITPDELVSEQLGLNWAPPVPLAPSTTYYWQVRARNAYGVTTGPVWQFHTLAAEPPGPAFHPSPRDWAGAVPMPVELLFTPAGTARQSRVFLGQDPGLADGRLVGETAEGGVAVAGLLPATTYFWRVDSVNPYGVTTGPVWRFTTASADTLLAEPFDQATLWQSSDANWKVTGGFLLYGQNTATSHIFCQAPGSATWSGYVLETSFRCSDDDDFGVIFLSQDASNHYRLVMNRQQGISRLDVVVNGESSSLAQSSVTYQTNQPQSLRLETTGGQLLALLNGQSLFAETLPLTAFGQGGIGFLAAYNNGIRIDSVTVLAPAGNPNLAWSWLGAVDATLDPYLHERQWGWFYDFPVGQDHWLYSWSVGEWLYASPRFHPYVYAAGRGGWYYLFLYDYYGLYAAGLSGGTWEEWIRFP